MREIARNRQFASTFLVLAIIGSAAGCGNVAPVPSSVKTQQRPVAETLAALGIGVSCKSDDVVSVSVFYNPEWDNPPVTADDLLCLQQLPALSDLRLCDARLGDAGFIEVVKNLTRLKVQWMPGNVSDKGLTALVNLNALEALVIMSPTISDTGLQVVRHMPDLKSLQLHNATNVRGPLLSDLSSLQKLEFLDLSSTSVEDKWLEHLNGMPVLCELDLSRTPIHDIGVKQINDLPALSKLNLSWTAVTDEGILDLRRFPRLKIITAYETAVTPHAVKELARQGIRVEVGSLGPWHQDNG